MVLIVALVVVLVMITFFLIDDYSIWLSGYAVNEPIPLDSEFSDMEVALDTMKAQLANAHFQLARSNMNDKDIRLSQKGARIKALEMALENSVTQLTEVNLQLAEANMATQRQMTLNAEFSRRMKKGSKNFTDLPAHIKDMEVGLKVAQDQNVALMKEKAVFHETIMTQTTALTTTNERVASLEKDKVELTAEKFTLMKSFETLQAKLDDAHASIHAKDEDGHDLTKQIQFKADELHTMTLQLKNRDCAIADLESSLMDQAESLRNVARDIITDLEDCLADEQSSLQTAEHYISDLEDRLGDREASLESWERNMSGTIRAFTTQIAELQDQKAALEHENGELARDLRGFVSEVEVLMEEEEAEAEVSDNGATFGGDIEGEFSGDTEVEGEWTDDDMFSLSGYDEVQVIESVEVEVRREVV
jgi:chromosome segregation ATPase